MALARGRRRPRRAAIVSIAALAVFVAIQFVPVERGGPPRGREVDAPAQVAAVLESACYDCHSASTRWPWYGRVAPVSWWIAGHVREGRRELDFSDWPLIDFTAQDELLREIAVEVREGRMPPASYRWGHPEARLDGPRREVLLQWAGGG